MKEPYYWLDCPINKIDGMQQFPAYEVLDNRSELYNSDKCKEEIFLTIRIWAKAADQNCGIAEQWVRNYLIRRKYKKVLKTIRNSLFKSFVNYEKPSSGRPRIHCIPYEVTAWKLIGVEMSLSVINCQADDCCDWSYFDIECLKELFENNKNCRADDPILKELLQGDEPKVRPKKKGYAS